MAQRYYAKFATYLAERGRPTVAFDYRDIGGSRTGSREGSAVRMRDWCTLDVAGVLAWTARDHPGRPVHWIGHSMGGFALMGGEDMPGPAFLEWQRWCMTPRFLFGDPTLAETAHFAHFRAPIRFARVEDDVWGTPAAVEDIASRFTANTERTMWRVRLADAAADRIGHHGFFREQFRDTLWPAAVA